MRFLNQGRDFTILVLNDVTIIHIFFSFIYTYSANHVSLFHHFNTK
jgi:hypothetical protein